MLLTENFFLDYLFFLKQELNLSDNSILAYKRDIWQYFLFLQKEKILLKNITTSHILTFLLFLKQTFPYKNKSLARKIAALKNFHFFLFQEKINFLHLQEIETPRLVHKLPIILSNENILELIALTEHKTKRLVLRNKAIIELLYSSALRVSELINIKINDLNFFDKKIIVQGKGGYERVVPLSDEAIKKITDYLTRERVLIKNITDNVLFVNYLGKAISRIGIFKMLKKISFNNSFKKNIYPHLFRHSISTHLLEKGMNLRNLQYFLGHRNIETTQFYTHLTQAKIAQRYNEFHPRITKKKKENNDFI